MSERRLGDKRVCELSTRRRPGRLASTAALLLALAFGGCTSLVPAYERPPAPIAPNYAPEMTPASAPGGPAAADIEWQRFFVDARLQGLRVGVQEHDLLLDADGPRAHAGRQ